MEARGLTVLELIAAMSLVAILAATALWWIHRWTPERRLNAAVRIVVLELRRSRGLALSTRAKHRILFDPATDVLRPQRRQGAEYEAIGPAIGLPEGVDLVDCTAAFDAIGFSGLGTATTFGTVSLRNSLGREKAVVVDIVGRIRIA